MREFTKSIMSYTWATSVFGAQQMLNLFRVPRQGEPYPATEAFNNAARCTRDQMGDMMRATFRVGDNIQRGLVDLTFSVLTLGVLSPRGQGGGGGGGGCDWSGAASGLGQQTADTLRQGANVVGQAASVFGMGAQSAAQQTGWGPMPPPPNAPRGGGGGYRG
jgi:hypothetical protein